MAVSTIAHQEPARVNVGVDTHLDSHAAVVKDGRGRSIGTIIITADPAGYREVLSWARDFGEVESCGIEGTGSFGAGLARFLAGAGETVIEVIRPDRSTRRHRGKSDPLDAEGAARAVQAGEARNAPKSGEGLIEVIRCLRVARSSALKARTQAINALKASW